MFKLIYLIPVKSGIKFFEKRKIAFILSALLMIASTYFIVTKKLNWGIDFSGGIAVDVKAKSDKVDSAYLRNVLKEFNPNIQEITDADRVFDIRIGQKSDEENKQIIQGIKNILGDDVEYRNVQVVGPKVGDELIEKGILAVVLSLLAMAAYIWIRFDSAFAIGVLLALAHDVVATVGMFALLQIDFSLSSVAAILTIAGYSINDTVVSYDKMRENMGKYKKKPVEDLINESINETLSRTILTSVTTIIAVGCIFIFGGEVLQGFSSAMLFGVVIGTYSSIFIAMPVLKYLNVKAK